MMGIEWDYFVQASGSLTPYSEEAHAMKQSMVLAIGLAAIVLAVQSSHAQDQVGAPKNLTPQIVKNAVSLVKEGKRYSLARTLEIGIPTVHYIYIPAVFGIGDHHPSPSSPLGPAM